MARWSSAKLPILCRLLQCCFVLLSCFIAAASFATAVEMMWGFAGWLVVSMLIAVDSRLNAFILMIAFSCHWSTTVNGIDMRCILISLRWFFSFFCWFLQLIVCMAFATFATFARVSLNAKNNSEWKKQNKSKIKKWAYFNEVHRIIVGLNWHKINHFRFRTRARLGLNGFASDCLLLFFRLLSLGALLYGCFFIYILTYRLQFQGYLLYSIWLCWNFSVLVI